MALSWRAFRVENAASLSIVALSSRFVFGDIGFHTFGSTGSVLGNFVRRVFCVVTGISTADFAGGAPPSTNARPGKYVGSSGHPEDDASGAVLASMKDDVLPDWPWCGCVVGTVDDIGDASVEEEFAGIEPTVVPDLDDTPCTIVDVDDDMPAIGMRVFDTS